MKHDFVNIMHDRLSKHEMAEPSGLWKEIENSLDSRGTQKKSLLASRRAMYKAVAGVAAAVLVAVVMWTTMKDDSNHDSASQEVAVNTSNPSKMDGQEIKAEAIDHEDKAVNNTPQLATTNQAEKTTPTAVKRRPNSTNGKESVENASHKTSASGHTPQSLRANSPILEEQLAQEMESGSIIDSALNENEQIAKKDLAFLEEDTVSEKVDTSLIIPHEPAQQLPQLWAINERPREKQRQLEISLSYNGWGRSMAGFGTSSDYAVTLANSGSENSSPEPFEPPLDPQDQGPVKIDEKEQVIPVRIGLEAWYPIGEKWRIGSGLAYTHLTRKITTIYNRGNLQETIIASYLGIPLEVSRVLWGRRRWSFYASAGAMIEFNLKSKLQEKADVRIINIKEFKDRRPQFSALGRLGLQYNVIDRIGIYLEPGASYYFHNGADDNIYMSHPFRFDINLGIKINLGK